MTRVCGECKRYLGERCRACGSENLTLHRETNSLNSPISFRCRDCEHSFWPGEGGITTGLCEECEARLKEEVVGKDEIRA